MRAIEFVGQANDGIIKIPARYKALANSLLRIILLTEEETVKAPESQKEKLKSLFRKAGKNKVFKKISNPSQWQKELRNEWD